MNLLLKTHGLKQKRVIE